MIKDNWLTLLILSVLGVAGYILLTKPEEEADLRIPEEDWWG